MFGPGKYDDVATMARVAAQARGAIMVIVVGGSQGSGFSVQIADPTVVAKIPEMLRSMADQIEQDLKDGAL